MLGTVGTLSRFDVGSVHTVRYLAPTEAQIRFGQLNGGRAAILIELARNE